MIHPALAWVIRRFVLAPLLVLLTVTLWTSLPLWLLATGIASAFVPGWLRPVRLAWIVLVHLTLETVGLVVLLALWVGSGFGWRLRRPWFERMHYAIMRAYLVVFFREARRVLRLKIETVGTAPDAFPGHPLVVLCRHAGPGDSFSIMYALMHWYQREPRVVLKEILAWDPALGVLLARVPSRFIRHQPGRDLEAEIGELARHLDANDAFVIFPEGGNFTAGRRTRSIARLRKLGHKDMADRAEAMAHVLAPRPGGVLAALEAAPEADVLMVAHTGLDHLDTLGQIWQELPMDKRLLMGWWRVPRDEIPTSPEDQLTWLYDWWQRIDDWVAKHKPVDLPRQKR